MKNKISFIVGLITLLISPESYALKTHNGYIVKLKSHGFINQVGIFKKIAKVKRFDFSFGSILSLRFEKEPSIEQLTDLKNHPSVEYIEPNYLCYNDNLSDHDDDVVPTPKNIKDIFYKNQWSLKNTGHNTWQKNSPVGIDLNMEKAWKITDGSKRIIIATVDSGIKHNHPDLKKNLWVNQAELNGRSGVDDDGNGYIDDIHGYDFHNNDGDPMDGLGHGTHVAGIIGAAHNKFGIRGIMGKVQIMGLKFLSDKGPGDTLNAALAVEYAINNGAHIINNSWYSSGKSKIIFDAFKKAKEAGLIVTASAGNKNKDNDKNPKYPSNLPFDNIITVGSLNASNNKASFSNYGKTTVDVFAPGTNIISTDVKKQYSWRRGTSMSTPMVSAALGLLISKYPNMDYKEVKQRLLDTAIKDKNYLKYGVSGRVDTYRLLMNITN